MLHRYYTRLLIVILTTFSLNAEAEIFDNLQPVQIATGMQFTEGPTWHPDGYLVFCDATGNVIYKWSETTGLKSFVASSGNAIGLATSKKNDFVVCRQGSRDVARMDTLGKFTVQMSKWNGKKLNGPNDAVFSYLGSIYFTDPDFGTVGRELTFQGLYCIPYNATNTPVLLDSTLVKPNGLTFVQDWKTLYVCESSTNTIYTYTLSNESTVNLTSGKKVFLKVTGTGEIDGITSDVLGNIYVAFGDGGVKIYDKAATLVGTITLPAGEKVRNLCFGGRYNNQLFITAGTSVYKVDIRFFGDFIGTGILSAPTDTSAVLNVVSDKAMSAYVAYGTSAQSMSLQTPVTQFPASQTMMFNLNRLSAGTRYYYQLYYRLTGESTYKTGVSGSFTTQRTVGQSFSFAVEADPHLDENSNYYTFQNTLRNMTKLQPDFLIDLGDNFMTEKFPLVNRYYIEQRNLLYRNFWDQVCNNFPLYIVVGNHEGELGWLNSSQADDEFNLTNSIRRQYYRNPAPNGFYTGNELQDAWLGNRQNYYAWNWGDALFVVIDPYEFTSTKPTDAWGFTLGKAQYDWFRSTLENSKAKYKFVFSHQLVGGDNLGRGGAERVNLAEMGGQNADGTYAFDTQRPGWGKPIHQLMKENGVQIYFHGHDHLYVEQPKDGIVYLEVPQPSLPNYTNTNNAASYGYVTGTILPCSGHIQVTVNSDSAKVDYIGGYHADNATQGWVNGTVRRSFSVKPLLTPTAIDYPISQPYGLEVYASDQIIYIRSSQNRRVDLRLTDLWGRKLQQINAVELSTAMYCYTIPDHLAKGLLLLEISDGQANRVFKIRHQ